MTKQLTRRSQAGFSLIELIIAMTITLVVLTIATTLIAKSLNIRTRANENVDTLADAERALNIMSREIAQSGFNLMPNDNGLIPEDSVTDGNGNSTIRIRANLNKFDTTAPVAAQIGIGEQNWDAGEDVKYFIYAAGDIRLLARYDRYQGTGTSTVLANRLDALHLHYFSQRVTYNTDIPRCDISDPSVAELPSTVGAKYVVIAVCVRQAEIGTPGSPGYQPRGNVLLTSDVALRNANLINY